MRVPRAVARCHGKKVYYTFEQAQHGIRGLKFQKGTDGPMSPYHCSTCGRFHVGHKERTHRRIKEIGVRE